MPQPGGSPPRVRVALVAACYVSVWLAGAVLHVARCADSPRPRCAVCACTSVVSVVAAPPSHLPVLSDRGAVDQCQPIGTPAAVPTDGVTRAPPVLPDQQVGL
jgi:hypothetical protein